MGDDAEYYIQQQDEEKRHQEMLRQMREDEITRERIKRERAVEQGNRSKSKEH